MNPANRGFTYVVLFPKSELQDGSVTRPWYLMSTHGVVLLHIARHPGSTLREMAEVLGLTERRISQIVQDLGATGYLKIERVGRRSVYTVNEAASMRHPTLLHVRLGDVLDLLMSEPVAPGGADKPAVS
jgi:DNA-binding MarR family transcriptional regulator